MEGNNPSESSCGGGHRRELRVRLSGGGAKPIRIIRYTRWLTNTSSCGIGFIQVVDLRAMLFEVAVACRDNETRRHLDPIVPLRSWAPETRRYAHARSRTRSPEGRVRIPIVRSALREPHGGSAEQSVEFVIYPLDHGDDGVDDPPRVVNRYVIEDVLTRRLASDV